jgi:hypothetical protein
MVILESATSSSGVELQRATPATTAKAPDIASVSIPDTLAALHVDPETGLIRGLPLARPSARQWVSACDSWTCLCGGSQTRQRSA